MRKKWQNRVRVVRKKLKGWNINYDLMPLFHDFFNGKLDVGRLNYGIITLLPKGNDDPKI